MRAEWEELKPRDVIFLLNMVDPDATPLEGSVKKKKKKKKKGKHKFLSYIYVLFSFP